MTLWLVLVLAAALVLAAGFVHQRSTEPTAVYEIDGPDGTLWYVGVTNNVDRRMAQHARLSPWFRDAASPKPARARWYRTRTTALAVEAQRIANQHPLYNRRGRWAT
jgi:predicted GIY-YIG superfamily endonuclease